MVSTDSQIIDFVSNSLFVHLQTIVQGLSPLGNGKGGSEEIREGAKFSQNLQQMMLSGFVSIKI
jgi:hypothetical protein